MKLLPRNITTSLNYNLGPADHPQAEERQQPRVHGGRRGAGEGEGGGRGGHCRRRVVRAVAVHAQQDDREDGEEEKREWRVKLC